MLLSFSNFKFIKGDVPITYADTSDLKRDIGYQPSTPLRDGLRKFVDWYRTYYFKNSY